MTIKNFAMIISLSGKPGSGKSTVAKRLAKELGYRHYYVGGMFRDAAQKKGMSLAEFLKWGEQNDQLDKEFDGKVQELGRTEDNFIIEGRMAWRFIPHSIKIFLDVTPEEGARRIWLALKNNEQASRNEARGLKCFEDVLKSVNERIQSDTYRYQKYYKANIFDAKHYDLYIDTSGLDREEEYSAVYSFIKSRIKKQ